MIAEVSGRIAELRTTIGVGLVHRSNLVQTIADQLEQWNPLLKKEKVIYHTLNMLSIDVTKKCLVAEGWWFPVSATNQIQNTLHSKYSAASNHRQQFANWGHIPGFANKRITTDLFPDKQIYFFFSRNSSGAVHSLVM